MIEKEQFIQFIQEFIKHEEFINDISNIFNIDLYSCRLILYPESLFDFILKILFKQEVIDDIVWWVFEKRRVPSLQRWDEEGNEIPTETLEDLWNIVKDFRK